MHSADLWCRKAGPEWLLTAADVLQGESLEYWTDGKLKANFHRVSVPASPHAQLKPCPSAWAVQQQPLDMSVAISLPQRCMCSLVQC